MNPGPFSGMNGFGYGNMAGLRHNGGLGAPSLGFPNGYFSTPPGGQAGPNPDPRWAQSNAPFLSHYMSKIGGQ